MSGAVGVDVDVGVVVGSPGPFGFRVCGSAGSGPESRIQGGDVGF